MARSFASQEEELQFWKDKAAVLEKEAKEIKEEFQEFQEGSRELELELETQLEQSEGKIKEFRSTTNRLQHENEQLKDKLEQCHKEYHFQVTELQTELAEIKAIKDQLNKYIRELEQQNDDLERAKRSTLASLEDFEGRMNSAIERNAFLESELDEKEALKAAVQRMKDETRDLRSELKVLHTTSGEPLPANGSTVNGSSPPDNDKSLLLQMKMKAERNNNLNNGKSSPDSNKHAAEVTGNGEKGGMASSPSTPILLDTPPSSSKTSPRHNSSTLTPSARLSALNIVGDLLRKVGALELKLSSCRNIVKENGAPPGVATPTTTTTTPLTGNGSAADQRRRSSRSATPTLN